MLAAVSWDGGGDGVKWSDALNWSGNQVPGANDDITIGKNQSVQVTGGLTINGTLSLGDTGTGNSGAVSFVGTQTLSGTGKVIFASFSDNNSLQVSGNSQTLTIGAGITIEAGTGNKGSILALTSLSRSIVNKGTIASTGGALALTGVANANVLSVSSSGSLRLYGTNSNTGAITINKGTLTLQDDWSNKGTLSAVDSTVVVEGPFTMSKLGTFTQTRGQFSLHGTLDNTGHTLDVGNVTWTLGGSIIGGTITSSGTGKLVLGTSGGGLSGVTISGDVLSAKTGSVTITNGLTLNGTIHLGAPAEGAFKYAASLVFMGTQTLSGTGTVVFSSDNVSSSLIASGSDIFNPSMVSIGSGISIVASAGTKGFMSGYFLSSHDPTPTGYFINTGTITSDGGALVAEWFKANTGVLEAVNGGTFTLHEVDVPTTTLSAPAAAQTGKSFSMTASVTPGAGLATGTVTLFEGATNLGTKALAGGSATFTLPGQTAGNHSYWLEYSGDGTYINNKSRTDTVAVVDPIQVVSTQAIASPGITPIGSWDVTFSQSIDIGSFDWQSVTLTRDGGANLITSGTGVSIALVSGKTYRISGLSGVTQASGQYTLRLVDGGVSDVYGFPLAAGAQRSWTMLPTVKNLSVFPAPRTAPVYSVAVRLSEPALAGTFTWQDITLTRNGGANLATSGITITQSLSDPAVYTITFPAALAQPVGLYSLTVNGGGIQNAGGLAFGNTGSTTWSIIAAVPSAPVLDASSEGKPGSTYTQYATPTMKGTGSVGSTVEIWEHWTLKGSGVVGADGKYLITLSTLSDGVHPLRARATDPQGTVTGYSLDPTIRVETLTPHIVSMSVYTAPRTVPVGSTGIRFSTRMDTTTITSADIVLTRNGIVVPVSGITAVVSPTDDMLYTLVIPAASNTGDGVYVLEVLGGGIKNLAGKAVGNNMSTTWTVLPRIMNMSQYSAARTNPVTAPGIRFSNPITLSTFTWADITLKRNGGANLATSAITIVASGWDPNVYSILIPSALTGTPGTYELTVTGAGIQSPNGYTVSNNMSTTWTQL